MPSDEGKELFIVEGKSAESTLRQAIEYSDKNIYQDVLALQGKLVNASKVSTEKVVADLECKKIFEKFACGTQENCKPEKIKYSRIFVLSDPDVDGTHSRALLLTLLNIYFRPLVNSGLISVIIPPLYRLTIKPVLASLEESDHFAWNEEERDQIQKDSECIISVTRFKGIAQFSQQECLRLFLDPETRRQINLN
ncbi:MAG: toprim domain-containing protein [Gammaproteobacteria bacterium]